MFTANAVGRFSAAGRGYLAVAVLAWIWMVYNSLVDLRQRVRQAWSLVDVQLQRRHDLIPNLVAMVKGYRRLRAALANRIGRAAQRAGGHAAGRGGARSSRGHDDAVAIAERYPRLKANANFMALQKNLVDTEQRIALARGYFNDIATHYNTRLEIVPERFVARLAGMQPQALMDANDFERAEVKVEMILAAGRDGTMSATLKTLIAPAFSPSIFERGGGLGGSSSG